MLKSGFQLDYQFEHMTEVTGNEVWRARDGQAEPREAVVCFDTQLAAETVDWLKTRAIHLAPQTLNVLAQFWAGDDCRECWRM